MATTLTSPSQAQGPQGAPEVTEPGKRRNPMAAHPALWLFPIPALVLYVAFFVVPTIQGVVYAVTDWDGFSPTAQFVGLDNFGTIFTSDDLFRNALSNNLKFMLVVVIFQTIFSLALAVYLTKNSKSSVALRSLLLLPHDPLEHLRRVHLEDHSDPTSASSTPCSAQSGSTLYRAPSSATTTQAIYSVAITQVWLPRGTDQVDHLRHQAAAVPPGALPVGRDRQHPPTRSGSRSSRCRW